MRIELDAKQLGTSPHGLEIGIHGFKGDPTAAEQYPSQVFIEFYKGKLQVHVWDGSSEDCQTIQIERER